MRATALPLDARKVASTSELVADKLRDEINQGHYRGGQALPQEELAERFGVSRMPVREALRRLEAEGLVVIYPNRGAFVTNPSPQEAAQAYELRLLLEPDALRRALPGFTPQRLRHCERLLDDLHHEHDPLRWRDLDNAFHAALYEACERPRLLEWIQALRLTVNRYYDLHLRPDDYAAHSNADHRRILDACALGDSAGAVAALRAHLEFAAGLIPAG